MNSRIITLCMSIVIANYLLLKTHYILSNIKQETLDRIIQEYEDDFLRELDSYIESYSQSSRNHMKLDTIPMAKSKRLISLLKRTSLNQTQKNCILHASVHSLDPVLAQESIKAGAIAPIELMLSLNNTVTQVQNSDTPQAYKRAMIQRLLEIITIVSSHGFTAAAA